MPKFLPCDRSASRCRPLAEEYRKCIRAFVLRPQKVRTGCKSVRCGIEKAETGKNQYQFDQIPRGVQICRVLYRNQIDLRDLTARIRHFVARDIWMGR